MSTTLPVVVIGGGVAGINAVRELEKKLGPEHVVLIEPREYAEVPFAMLRSLTEPNGLGRRARKPWSELSAVRHVRGRAKQIDGDAVILEFGDRVEFSQALVATGSTTKGYPFLKGGGATGMTERQAELETEAARLGNAQSVLIIGGGPIGVELSGEIKSTWPSKPVTLAEGSDRLLPALSEGAGKKAFRVLTKRGVSILTNAILTRKNGSYAAPDGDGIEADLVIHAVGVQPNPIPVDGDGVINEHGQIKVQPTLQVSGRTNVFAVGDVTDLPEVKLGALTRAHNKVAVGNIVALRSGATSLKVYKPSKPMSLVTLGRKGGIGQMPFGRADFMAGLKQKDMLVSMYLGK